MRSRIARDVLKWCVGLICVGVLASWPQRAMASFVYTCMLRVVVLKIHSKPKKGKGGSQYEIDMSFKPDRLITKSSRAPGACEKLMLTPKTRVQRLRMARMHYASFFKVGDPIQVQFRYVSGRGGKWNPKTQRYQSTWRTNRVWTYKPSAKISYTRRVKAKGLSPRFAPKAKVQKQMKRWLKQHGHKPFVLKLHQVAPGKGLRLSCEKGHRCDAAQPLRDMSYTQKDGNLQVTFRKSIWKARSGDDLRPHVKHFFPMFFGVPIHFKGWDIAVNWKSGLFGDGIQIRYLKLFKDRIRGEATMRFTYLDATLSGDPYCKAPDDDTSPPAACSISLDCSIKVKFIVDLVWSREKLDCSKKPYPAGCK